MPKNKPSKIYQPEKPMSWALRIHTIIVGMKTTNNNRNNKENKRKWNARRIFDSGGGIRITNSEKIVRGSTNQLYSDLEALPFHVDHFLKHVLIESWKDIITLGLPVLDNFNMGFSFLYEKFIFLPLLDVELKCGSMKL